MKIEKNFNGKVSFTDLIKKSEEENLPLIEVVKEYSKIYHPSLEEKTVKKSILVADYVQSESTVQGLMSAEITEENVVAINKQVNDIRNIQEVMLTFTMLNLFSEEIEFDIETEAVEMKKQYDILFQEGVFNYFHTLIGGEWDMFLHSFNRDAAADLNNGAITAVNVIMKELTKDLDESGLNELKTGLNSLITSDEFKRVAEVADKIK